ncbi:MAG: hypothetical protein NC548_41900 [Lachnospiraceae bacterium]|nr:hypothetical protein [Lachnospiraceae bacterium]
MVASEILHNGIATLAISAGLIVAGQMFDISSQYRIASQLWQSLPMCFLSEEGVFDPRLIVAGGQCFTAWQGIPVIYIICGIVIAVIGKNFYRRYQVSGR